jgi:S1-C subfamily serine protease
VSLPKGARIASLRAVKDVAVGERVFSIGNPRGLEQTLSEGLVSASAPRGRAR